MRTGPTIRLTSGVCLPGASCFAFERAGCCKPLVPLVWANAPDANSATAMPKRQRTEAVKTRRLKKADFAVDFFFIDGSGVVSLSGKPEMVARILDGGPKPCQLIFQILIKFLRM